MFRSYLVTAINNLTGNKLYSLINISGLAAGLAAFILIILFVRHETSFDRHWRDADRIYLVVNELSLPPGSDPRRMTDFTSFFGPDSLDDFLSREIEASVVISPFGRRFRFGDTAYEGGIDYVDPEILDMFQFETLAGDLAGTFHGTGGIALSEDSALKFFGDTDVIGERVSLENDSFDPKTQGQTTETRDFRVTAVYRPAKGNTVLDLPAMALLQERPVPPPRGFFIRAVGPQYYVKLKPGVAPETVNGRLREFVEQNANQFLRTQGGSGSPLDITTLELQPLNEVYFDPVPPLDKQGKGNHDAVRIYSAVSALVLFIGCINFVILSTAKATQRAREVAVRKVLGAKPGQLIAQFLGESLILSALAMMLALVLVGILLPFFDSFLNLSLQMDYSSVETWLFLAAVLLAVGFLGGLYPALVISRFSPDKALHANRSDQSGGSIRLRGVLVVFQFAISIALIVATLIVHAQLAFIKLDPGYNPENLLMFQARSGILVGEGGKINYIGIANIDTLKQELLALPEVTDVALTSQRPNDNQPFFTQVKTTGLDNHDPVTTQMPVDNIGYDFFSALEIPLVAGRLFEQGRDQDMGIIVGFVRGPDAPAAETRIVLNVAATRQLGFSSAEAAIGNTVTVGNNVRAEIIGVVADARYLDIWQEPRAQAWQLNPALSVMMAVRFRGNRRNVRTTVERIWSSMGGEGTFSAEFADDKIDQAFTEEENLGRVFMLLSVLAILISAMGLYGMASFTVDRRVKEIGIRKVMGARVSQIVSLLLWQFSIPVLIAAVIAWLVVLYAVQGWLQRFPLQISLVEQLEFCLLAVIISLVIACLTVAGNTLRVATSNPVDALRYE